MNIEESNGQRLYNKSTCMTRETLALSVDVTNLYDKIHSDDVGNDKQIAKKAIYYAYKMDSELDKRRCSTGIEMKMIKSAGNLLSKRSKDIAYETLASTKRTSNVYDTIQSGTGNNALDRQTSLDNTKVYTNMIFDTTDFNLTENNPDTAKSFEVWTKTESQKELPGEYENFTFQRMNHQDEFKSRKNKAICIFLLITVLLITTIIITMVFTVFKDDDVEECIPFIAPENGFMEVLHEMGSLVVGTKITISCREGYFVDGNDTVVCSPNRTWSESPTCEIRDCGIPSDITNGHTNDLENTTFNSTFTVECDEGYVAVGIITVLCDMNGTWTERPNCRPVSCEIPQVLDNETKIVYNDTTFGATANFRCIDGYSLMGASFTTCLSNGSWTQIPSCFRTIGSACEEAMVLHDLVRRSRIYQADGVQGSDPFVDDEYLFPDWYSVIFNGKQYLMSGVNTMPQYNFCGTENPIYLKHPHPEVETMAATATVCEKTSSSDCQNMHTIAIRKCGNDNIQYFLPRTNSKSAYCFDPPDIKNITEF
ncbi:complement receptor type 2-like [Mercenaria mercenaria]|uniref:complement receptor type 2-like n=1 Tax=Mercenaria mercenaria TaxID=6596 RepID=UPI00234EFF78|nr:complement receptor type 2-like [Mercenaria mercenaria]